MPSLCAAVFGFDLMPCFKPLTAWRSKEVNPSGKRGLVFNSKQAYQPDDPLQIACGQCVGCRLERSRQWAVRCVHEAQMHERNAFITLTFNDESLESRERPLSLDKSEFQKFMKRLRKRLGSRKIKYFHCGEYGSVYGRPHYHACIFGHDFPDRELWTIRDDVRLYRSRVLEELWTDPKTGRSLGFCSVGDVTFESAAYVARYCLKKITGDLALTHYAHIDYDTGEILYDRVPEYTTMSNGIGKSWYNQFRDDVFPADEVIVRGVRSNVPKYYDKLLEKENNYDIDYIKEKRVGKALKNVDNNTPERLKVREFCQKEKIKLLKRVLE